MWPSANAVIAGASSRQTSIASGQRGWKWQPAGGASGLGISPAHGAGLEPPPGVGLGDRVEQRPGVRVLRPRQHLVGRAGLDDPPEVHHGDAVGDVLDDRQVVGDEDQRHAELALEVADQVQDLGLHEHVERRDRLVGDDQVGPERQRRGDRHPLALAARELVRAASRRGAATARRSRAARPPARSRSAARADAERVERLAHRAGHRPARVERAVGVLEDRLHAAAEARAGPSGGRRRRPPSNRTVPAVGAHQPEQAPAERRLPRARLADDRRAPRRRPRRGRRRRPRAASPTGPSRPPPTRKSRVTPRASSRAGATALTRLAPPRRASTRSRGRARGW